MNKKGFTTMELLAVIIVLVVLSTITISILTNTIQNADKKAAEESAYGYVNALNMEIIEGNYSSKKLIKSGYYYTQYLAKELDFDAGGANPKDDSWVYVNSGEVKKYSLKFKKFSATKLSDEISIDKNVSEHDICFKLSVKYKNVYNHGDSYSCYVGDGSVRTFYVLEDGDSEESTGKTPEGKITLIMEENLTDNYDEEEIEELTKDWINVDMPTKAQIEASEKQEFLKLKENYIVSDGDSNTIMTIDGFDSNESNYGYRPVIVIDK